ncbi:hypothetical protein ACZ90_01100 [Streptomyces albus subsp. albus]|nr:hypothetical protein ACZ90_01100 [Streptomyces albus subsp. albus]
MSKSVPVRCPACRHEQSFTPPTFTCACGAPITLPIAADQDPHAMAHRTWEDCWAVVDCAGCERRDHWPWPELDCPCGTVIRIPVVQPPAGAPGRSTAPGPGQSTAAPGSGARRPAFRPVTIRTARDAVNAAAHYLRWLGFQGLRPPENRATAGADLRGPDVVAQVDPTTHPTTVREVECLWLTGLNESVTAVFFSLAGYARDSRHRADELRIPLFVMDLTGTPQPVNDAADELIRRGP